MNKSLAATALLSVLSSVPAQAALTVGSSGFTYAQNFDSLTQLTTPAQTWTNDVTLPGWSLFNSASAAITTYVGDTGSSNTGSFVSYGSAGSSDRALGGLASGGAYFGSPASGAVAGWIALSFTNATGASLVAFDIRYDGEQWRNGGNTSTQTMVLEYGYGNSFTTVTTWTAAGSAFNFQSPIATATAAAVDGNAAGRVSNLGFRVPTSWAAGATLWVRWIENNDAGNDHGLAIDNLSFSVSAVPEPGTVALLLAGVASLGFLVRRRR